MAALHGSGALRAQTLAPDHHLLDASDQRPHPRSAGRSRRSVWNYAGFDMVLIYEIRLSFSVARFGLAPQLLSTDYLLGLRRTLGACVVQLPGGIQGTLFFFTILIAFRYLLRKPWAAALGFVAVFTALKALGSPHPAIEIGSSILIYGIAAFALVRFGLVMLAVAVFVANIMLNVPATFDFSRWYAPNRSEEG